MEKRKPSFDLEAFRLAAGNPATLNMTRTAMLSANDLGFDFPAVAKLIRTMKGNMFYKAMTSYADHRRWQDVYHVPTEGGMVIYLKFTDDVVAKFTVLSFKER